jgi:hypothetical protein
MVGTLQAAPITFQNEIVNNSIRGSLLTLVTVMKARYLQQVTYTFVFHHSALMGGFPC